MESFHFNIPAHSTRRYWAIYAIVAKSIKSNEKLLYIGKVGDNRAGCNPIISRIGNHFSFNKIHSQFKNYLKEIDRLPDRFNYSIHYLTSAKYNETKRENQRESINEAERFLNLEIQSKNLTEFRLLNPYAGNHINKREKLRRLNILTEKEKNEIIEFMKEILETQSV